MTQEAHLESLLAELGPADPSIASVRRLAAGHYLVEYDDGVGVELVAQPERGRLLLLAAVGELPAADQLARCKAMLNFNALWRQTGGVRLALAGDEVQQLYEHGLDGLELDSLRRLLANFAEKVGVWHLSLLAEAPAAAASAFTELRV
jgi:hypothetical protein